LGAVTLAPDPKPAVVEPEIDEPAPTDIAQPPITVPNNGGSPTAVTTVTAAVASAVPLSSGFYSDTPTPHDWSRWDALKLRATGTAVERLFGTATDGRNHRWYYEPAPSSTGTVQPYRIDFDQDGLVQEWSVSELPVYGADESRFGSLPAWEGLATAKTNKDEVVVALGPPTEYTSSHEGTVYFYGFASGRTGKVVFDRRGLVSSVDSPF